MTTVERSVQIGATADEIDAVVLDGNRLPEWFEGVESVNVDDTYPEPGGKVEMTYKAAGMSFEITLTSTDLARGEHATFQMDGMMTGTHHWTYTPAGDGIELKARFDYDVPGGGLGKIADKLVVERMNTSNLEKSLEKLKNLIEG